MSEQKPITMTIQHGHSYNTPWMYSYEPGQRFVVEHKVAGKIIQTDEWVLVQVLEDLRRWVRVARTDKSATDTY